MMEHHDAYHNNGYLDWWGSVSDSLGGIYPFYELSHPDYFSLSLKEIIMRRKARGGSIRLDPTAVVCKACMPYILGDRTLLCDVRRAPWMENLEDDGVWASAVLPEHGYDRPKPGDFLHRLERALLEEIAGYIGEADTVGILLSGGMDSRVVAGLIRMHQLTHKAPNKVVALTWGGEGSRDVIYANQIAKRFGWDSHHFPLNADTLRKNIDLAGLLGAEVSPLHLHAMAEIADLRGIDVIIAGSYGDSVGRAEFSGRHVKKLKSVIPRVLDKFGVVHHSILVDCILDLQDDAWSSPHFAGVSSALRRHEIEQEMHYMRRMLQACMQVIASKIPLFQMFTSKQVFSLMWQLDPDVRDNSWYYLLLKSLPGNLLDIPWARTGRLYESNGAQLDSHSVLYHAYGEWLRTDHKDLVISRVNSEAIRGLGIFNDAGLDNVLTAWLKAKTKTTNSLDEFLSWLASLYVFVTDNNIDTKFIAKSTAYDAFSVLKGKAYAGLYVSARNWSRG